MTSGAVRVSRRYRLNAVNQVFQPLDRILFPGLLLGATFASGGDSRWRSSGSSWRSPAPRSS